MTRATMAGLAMLLAACGTSGDGGGGGGAGLPVPGGPSIIQPQPIPDEALAARFDATTLTATATAGGVDLAGSVHDGGPPGASNDAPFSAIDLSTASAIVTVDPDASGTFTVHLPGGALGDRVLLFFPGDVALGSSLEVPTLAPTTAKLPCVAADGALGLQLPPVVAGTTAQLPLTFSTTCGSALAIDAITVVGDAALQAPSAGFDVPASGVSATQTFLVTPPSAGSYTSLVILAAGDDRSLFLVTGTGD